MKGLAGALAVAVLLGCPVRAWAQDEKDETKPAPEKGAGKDGERDPDAVSKELEARLAFQTGKITLGQNLATLQLTPEWRFLGKKDARFVVEDVWGNPPDDTVLGMVFPKASRLPESWGIVITSEQEGYVKDDDAAGLKYDELLATMQQGTRDANEERRKQGYPTCELLGWAEPPHYDSAAKKLYWAKRISFEGAGKETLNYDVRILGRRGVLVFTAVAATDELAQVREGCQAVLKGTEFTSGNRYSDFDSSTDKEAAYGIGGLIVGGVVAAKLVKGGLLAKLGIFLLKALKPLLVGVAVLVGSVAKFFKRTPSSPPAT